MSAIYLSSVGAELDQIEPHTQDVQRAIEEMNRKLPTETRILEGTEIPLYVTIRQSLENELSQPKLTEEQWKSALQNGSLTTDPIPTSTQDLSSSSSTAENSNPNFRTVSLRRQCTNSPISSCSEMSEDYGIEIDVMNESSECTVPMTSELMLGMRNEVK